MVEIPHGVAFQERQKELLQKKSRLSRLSRFLSSITGGKYTDPKPVVLSIILAVILGLLFYFSQIFIESKSEDRLIAPEGYKIIYPKDAPPRLEKI
jgi:hypothetical protein